MPTARIWYQVLDTRRRGAIKTLKSEEGMFVGYEPFSEAYRILTTDGGLISAKESIIPKPLPQRHTRCSAHQMDVDSAFLNASLNEEICMTMAKVFRLQTLEIHLRAMNGIVYLTTP